MVYIKDPDDTIDFVINWGTNWLGSGESIASSTWNVPAGITKDSDTSSTTTATIWLSGGTVDGRYTLTNTIVTDNATARTRSFSFAIKVKER